MRLNCHDDDDNDDATVRQIPARTVYLRTLSTSRVMALEKWLGIASLALFAMFSGLMVSVYGFLSDVPDDFDYALAFEADPKLLQFISISAAPAGVMGAVAFLLSRYYGSRPVGTLLIAGGCVMLAGMAVCHAMMERIDDAYMTDAVVIAPYVFMGLSAPVMAFGARLFKSKKRRPKKEYY